MINKSSMTRVFPFKSLPFLKTRGFFFNSSVTMSSEKMCNDAREIFNSAVSSVQPRNLINKTVEVHSNFIKIHEQRFFINKNCHIVGFGKAVLGMARALEEKLRDHLVSGIISIPHGMVQFENNNGFYSSNSCIQVYQGACNNVPDENSQLAALKISEYVTSLKETDIVFVLISGGGSALLPFPKEPLTLLEKLKVIKLLASKGASIEELNTVRKRLSKLKGGGLAKLAKPAKVISLLLSDIVGDPLGLIASGPTVENTDDPQLPLKIFEKYNLKDDIPSSAMQLLTNIQSEDLTKNSSSFDHVSNFIIGNNQVALEAAEMAANNLKYNTSILTSVLIGKASYIGVKLILMITAALNHEFQLVHQISSELNLPEASYHTLLDSIEKLESKNEKVCFLFGGETTVEVKGDGIGGRNQELALAAAIQLKCSKPKRNVILLSAGTDGIDGPTDASGSIATEVTAALAEEENLNPNEFLRNNDSYTFYSKLHNGQFHVKTGHTGTNVMDIIIILMK